MFWSSSAFQAQDELGDRQACENAVRVALRAGQHVVVDGRNVDPPQRAHWVKLARECGAFGTSVVALQLLLPLELCRQRARDRVGHPYCIGVFESFANGFVEATSVEGFDRVISVRTSEEAVLAVEQLLREGGAHTAVQQQQPQQQQWNTGMYGGLAASSYYSGQVVQYGNYVQNGSHPQGHHAYQPVTDASGGGIQGATGAQQGLAQAMSFAVTGAQEGGSIGGQGLTHGSNKRACRWERREGESLGPHGVVSGAQPNGGMSGQVEGTAGGRPSSCQLLPSSLAPAAAPPPAPPAPPARQQQEQQQYLADGSGVDLSHQQHQLAREQPAREEEEGEEQQQQQQERQQQRQKHWNSYSQGSGGFGGGGSYGRGGGGGGYRRQEGTRRDSQWHHRDVVQRLRHSFADPSSTTPYDVPAEPGAEDDPRVILLFDLNGTLTSHTSVRRAQGTTRLRPGTAHLTRLRERFRLGIYTSSTVRTVQAAMEMLELAAGETLFDRRLVLHREHTAPAPADHVDSGGNPWDTLKPLGRYFSRLDRVVLVDDDSYKSMAGEESNMLIVPCWSEEDVDCQVIRLLCEALIARVAPQAEEDLDVRRWTAAVSAQLQEAAKAAAPQSPSAAAATSPEAPEAAKDSTSLLRLGGEEHGNGAGGNSGSSGSGSSEAEAEDEREEREEEREEERGDRGVEKGGKDAHLEDEGTVDGVDEQSRKRHRV
ncbi:hypothetical protein VOLCADRAFT_104348 [Volvox carteri f. nagariensis]|uniref:FCP1 homology domain-containing protein n=1 Tax=Volvox carteri f. nagariensis TaxID=3068 RepID=D8TT51_VOLCA|nr:uncharacterized protein VOLCADRAFT_104348 [Volvox carteri f. nagariensis]EFJ49251.1 hypothetical protein VOLCADRAFT_104348 [Volvox carteri f. nagariensis]|eukprot:XP_002949699.1 hypothetical protein VOLCADRAFT_104348 [Volvox carteri f. nagariensis]